MNEFNVLLAAATNGTPSGSLFDALFARYIAPQESWCELESPLPITILAAGEDLIDYLIYGNTVQNGTPTPENPIMPSGCGERTENLLDVSQIKKIGTYHQSGKYTFECDENTTYMFLSSISMQAVYVYGDADYSSDRIAIAYSTGSISFNTGARSTVYIRFDLDKTSDDYRTANLMLVEGSTAPTSYIPFGYKLPLTSAGQDVDIYLGEVPTTRRIKKLVLTGEENWLKSTSRQGSMYISIRDNIVGGQSICDRATNALGINDYTFGKIYMEKASSITNFLNIWLFDNNISVADFKSYLAAQYQAGTPVTVWYVLEEPEAAVVNEPLMKIGDYADTLSMEQAGVSIPTNKGETIIDYNPSTTPAVEPEKMYIKYKPQ